MGPFKKKKNEKQRLLSDDYGDDDEPEVKPESNSNGDDFFSTGDDFDIQPTGAGFDEEFGGGAFNSDEPFEADKVDAFPSSADPAFPGSNVEPEPDKPEDFDAENFQPKDLGSFDDDEPFELVIKDLDKERELVEKGEDPSAAKILVDFPSARKEKEEANAPAKKEADPEPEPMQRKGRRMRRFSLGAKPMEDESDDKGQDGVGQKGDFDGFDASFSALALEMGSALGDDPDAKKKKKSIKKIFGKGKEPGAKKPAGHSAEIVVDKSKIPTQKIAPEVKDGELFVNFPSHEDDAEQSTEKEKKSGRFKSLKESIKKKVGKSTMHLIRDIDKSDGDDDEEDEPKNLDASSGHNSDAEIFDSDEEELDKQSARDNEEPDHDSEVLADARRRTTRTRRRQSVSGGTGPSQDAGSHVDRRARRREGRVDGRALRTRTEGSPTKDEGQDGRPSRRHRHSTLSSDHRPRRQTLLEKHQAGTHGPRLSQRSKHEHDDSTTGSTADSTYHGEESVTSGDASLEVSKHKEGRRGTDTSRMSSSSRNEEAMKLGGRHALLHKAKSRRVVDPLGGPEKPPTRRVPAADMLKHRAMSTRKIGLTPPPNDTKGHTSQNSSQNSPRRSSSDGDHKKRMSRQFVSERNNSSGVKHTRFPHKTRSSEDKNDGLQQSSSDHDELRKAHGSLLSDEKGQVHGWTRNIVNANGSRHKKDAGTEDQAEHEHEPAAQTTSENLSSALASGNLSKEEVEKLVRLVALQAKEAKSTDDLESIVLGALHGDTKKQDESTNRDGINSSVSSFVCDEDDDITLNSGNDDHECQDSSIKSEDDEVEKERNDEPLSAEEIQNKARNYVQDYLRKEKTDDGELESSGHSKSLKKNYAKVFMNLDASVKDGGSMREQSKRGSLKDESRGSMKDESKASMRDSSKRSMKDGSKRSDISNVLTKLEEAKRKHDTAKARSKAQVAK